MAEVKINITANDQTEGAFNKVEASAGTAFSKIQAGCVSLVAVEGELKEREDKI